MGIANEINEEDLKQKEVEKFDNWMLPNKRKSEDPLPVTVLTGFLGSGKTTLLNKLLSNMDHKMKFAVIENEFGEVGIDENILVEKAEGEQVIEVLNGCICCTVRGDLT